MDLNLMTKFLLLAHKPEKKGLLISIIHINYGIIGAALLEMTKQGQVKIEGDNLILLNSGGSNNSIVKEIAHDIKSSKKNKGVQFWVTKLARKSKNFKWTILADLEKKRLLRIEHKKFLWLFPYRDTYLLKSDQRNHLICQLKNAVLSGEQLDHDTIMILGLIEACQMHKILTTDKDELKKLKKELTKIIKESAIADTVDKTIRMVQTVILGAVMTSAVVTTTTGAS